MKKIKINHLGYTVYLNDIKKFPKNRREEVSGLVAWVTNDSLNSSTIWARLPIRKLDTSTIGHEIIHVLQNIANARHIDFILEKEHFGYMFNYIMNECLEIEYDV